MKSFLASGPLARFFSLLIAISLAACASTTNPAGEATLRPGPQRLPTLRAQGDLVIATLQGATVTVQPLSRKGLNEYYSHRPNLVNPFKKLPKSADPPLAFVVRIQNLGRNPVNFDPSQVLLVDQRDRRTVPLPYDDLYTALSEDDDPNKALQSLQETILSNYVVIPPKLDREGLLVFPPLDPDVKTVIVEIGSLYIGSVEQLLLFEFEAFQPRKPGAIGMFGL